MDRILVLSFQPQSGKTTLALQLSHYFHQQGRPVVLLDFSNDQRARKQLIQSQDVSSTELRAVEVGKDVHMLSKVWAQTVRDQDTVVIDTSSRLEQARLDYLMRQVNSVLLLADLRDENLNEFEHQFSDLIKRVRTVRSRLVVVATHSCNKEMMRVVQLRQRLDLFQIPLLMKLEQQATPAQCEMVAQMLLSEEVRVDSVSGNRLGRALHPATARAGSMVGGIETLSEIMEAVKQRVLLSDRQEIKEVEEEGETAVQMAVEELKKKSQQLARENERLRG